MSNYAADKEEAEALDRRFGFAIPETEAVIQRRLAGEKTSGTLTSETWAHLSPQTFQTPYAELARLIEDADPARNIRRWADLGAAYGRLGLVLDWARPGALFVGIEIVPERVYERQRVFRNLGLDPGTLRVGNVATDPLPDADLYFIYDFGTRVEIAAMLEALRVRAQSAAVTVVGRGRAIRDAIEREHPWLAAVIPPRHFPHYSIYSSADRPA